MFSCLLEKWKKKELICGYSLNVENLLNTKT